MTAQAPDVVYGRLLEAAHISGYSFERVCSELDWLLDDDRWRAVGGGYERFDDFLGTIDLSPFNMETGSRKRLSRRLVELGASTRQAAEALGVSNATVSRDVTDVTPRAPDSSPDLDVYEPTVTDVTPLSEPQPAAWFDKHPADVGKSAQRATAKENAAAETQARRGASRSAPALPDGADLRIGDARDVLADVANESVALVLTDPPYGDEAQPLYEWLAEWSARVLVPGGSLVCFTGQSRLDRDIAILGEHLRYWWLLSMLHHQSQRLPGKFVTAEFKPVLWFVKETRRGRTLVNDVLRSPKREKDDHDWGQGEGGVTLLVEQLTDPAELVADPFAGTARWGDIAASMGRRWVGADIAPGGTSLVVAV